MKPDPDTARDMPKADRVYLALRQRIREVSLLPGAPLRKEELAEEFDVSRAPVNEAIARLAEEGLVDVFPQHGSFVATIRPEDVREGMFVRMGLEVEAIRRVTLSADQALRDALDENIAGQKKALKADDLVRFYRLDEALHDLIFTAIGHSRVRRYLDSARAPLDRMRRLTLPKGERAVATLREHRWLVDAIKSGDVELAEAAMRAHLNAATRAVEDQLQTSMQGS